MFSGTVRSVSKKGVQQWDVLLNFQTKRLFTYLNGTVTRSDGALATKLNLKYRFLNGPDERVHTEFKISKKTTNIETIQADLRLECSAYSQFNFEALLIIKVRTYVATCAMLITAVSHSIEYYHGEQWRPTSVVFNAPTPSIVIYRLRAK